MSIQVTKQQTNIREEITTLRGECSIDSIIHRLKDYRGGIDIGPGGREQSWNYGTFRFVSDSSALMIAESTDITSTTEIRAHNADGNSGGVYVGGSQFTPVGILANRLSLYTSDLDGINLASWTPTGDISFYTGQTSSPRMTISSAGKIHAPNEFDRVRAVTTSNASTPGQVEIQGGSGSHFMLVHVARANNVNANKTYLLLVNTRTWGFGGGNNVTVVSSTGSSTGTTGEPTASFGLGGSSNTHYLTFNVSAIGGVTEDYYVTIRRISIDHYPN